MGLIVLIVFGLALAAGIIPGAIGVVIHRVMRRRGRGSWWLFAFLAVVFAAALAAGAAFWAQTAQWSEGEPSEADWNRTFAIAALFGASPGLGLGLGALAALKPGSPQTSLPPGPR